MPVYIIHHNSTFNTNGDNAQWVLCFIVYKNVIKKSALEDVDYDENHVIIITWPVDGNEDQSVCSVFNLTASHHHL